MAASGIAFFIFPGTEPILTLRISTASFCRLRWRLSPATLSKKNLAKFLRTTLFRTPPVAASPQSLIEASTIPSKKKKAKDFTNSIFFRKNSIFSVKHGFTAFQTDLFSVTLFTCKKHPPQVFYKNRCS